MRFDGWDAHGDPVGRPVRFPEVLCVATEETQAGNTFDNCAYMLAEGAAFDAYPGIDVGRRAATSTRILLPGGGVIEPTTSGAVSKDGGKSSFIVFDETHLHSTPRTPAPTEARPCRRGPPVIRPILFPVASVNHMLPSEPKAIPYGPDLELGRAN